MAKKEVSLGLIRGLLAEFPALIKLIYRLLRDPRISGVDKAVLGGIAIYVLNPMDLMPDALPVIGQVDDVYLVALGLLRLINRADPALLREHWEGSREVISFLREVVQVAVFYLPARVRRILVGRVAEQT